MGAIYGGIRAVIIASVNADAIMSTTLQNEANSTLIKCEIVSGIGGVAHRSCLRPGTARTSPNVHHHIQISIVLGQ